MGWAKLRGRGVDESSVRGVAEAVLSAYGVDVPPAGKPLPGGHFTLVYDWAGGVSDDGLAEAIKVGAYDPFADA